MNLCFLASDLLALGRPELAQQLLSLLPVEETLPLLFQASLLPEGEAQYALLQRAEQAFGRKVRFPNTLGEVAMLAQLPTAGLPAICWAASTTASAATRRPSPCGSRCASRRPGLPPPGATLASITSTRAAIWRRPSSA
ncbi:hypothetical protein ACTFBV_08885 [Aeromonas rivipollensis]